MSFGLVDRLVGPAATAAEGDARRVGVALIWALLIGSVLAGLCVPSHWAEAMLWGDALALGGMLLGFLFGIPRFLARSGATVVKSVPPVKTDVTDGDVAPGTGTETEDRGKSEKQPTQPAAASTSQNGGSSEAAKQAAGNDASKNPTAQAKPAPTHDGVNTNLEEISDWLTKIIVGVSLVEVNKARTLLQSAAGYIAQALGGSEQSSVAYAILLYFSVTGFLGSYLLTRLYLQQAFRKAADDE